MLVGQTLPPGFEWSSVRPPQPSETRDPQHIKQSEENKSQLADVAANRMQASNAVAHPFEPMSLGISTDYAAAINAQTAVKAFEPRKSFTKRSKRRRGNVTRPGQRFLSASRYSAASGSLAKRSLSSGQKSERGDG